MADDPYAYDGAGEAPSEAGLVALCKRIAASKGKDALIKAVKQLASALEALPQDADALGRAKGEVPRALAGLAGQSLDKDVRINLAFCTVHMLRVWAPERPYEDEPERLEAALQSVLWVVNRLQNHAAPTFQLAVSVLQVFCETKTYYLLSEDREEVELEWFRALLDCVTEANADQVEIYVQEILSGMLEDDSLVSEAKVEALLSCLVSPAADENPAAAALTRSVLRQREREVQPTLQRLLTRLLTSPLTANSALCEQSYAIVAQLHEVTPQALLPVVPHLSDELGSADVGRRIEAVRLLGRLFGQRGGAAVAAEWGEVLLELLRRFRDDKPEVRLEMVQVATKLVGRMPSDDVRARVLEGVCGRLMDTDDKVRISACKAVCAIATAHPGTVPDNSAAAVAGTPRGSPVPASLEDVAARMRDLKPAVRRAAAIGLLALLRSRVNKAGLDAAEGLLWIPARALLCACSDVQLRHELETGFWREGLLGPSAAPGLAAQAWARAWRAAQPAEATALLALLAAKASLQFDALAFLELRRMLGGTEGDQRAALHARLDAAARKVARHLPDPARAEQQLAALRDVKDNRVAAALLAALALGARSEATARAATDALQRVGSKSALAEFLRTLLAYAQPSLLPPEVIASLLELAAGQLPAPGGGRPQQGGRGRKRAAVHGSGSDGSGSDADGSGSEEESGSDAEAEAAAPSPQKRGAGRRGRQQQEQQPASAEPGAVPADVREAAFALCVQAAKRAGTLFAGHARRLAQLLEGQGVAAGADAAQLQTLAALALAHWARCAAGLSPSGAVVGAAAAAAPGQQQQQARQSPRRSRTAAGEAAAAAAAAAASPAMADDAAAIDALRAPLLRVAGSGEAPLRAAKHAVIALHFLYGQTCAEDLSQLCGRLMRALTPRAAADPAVLPHLQALSAVGRVLPDVIAPHAEALVTFVTRHLLSAYLPRPAGAARAAAAAAAAPPTVAAPGHEVAAKCAALRALAKALTPESEREEVRVETIRAAGALMDEIEGLLDVDSPPAWLPPDADDQQAAAVRLAAALALLRLARRHDVRLPRALYCLLALTTQDPVADARRAFSVKLGAAVGFFNKRPHYHQLSAKYAAMLALGAADPVAPHRRGACAALRDWAERRRGEAQRMITAAAADRGADGGSTIAEQPEMAVPYLIYLLGHHPDMPVDAADEGFAEALVPFQHMLQAALAPLLAPAQSGAGEAAASLPLVLKMLQRIRATEDAADDDASATPQMRALCEAGTQISVKIACGLLNCGLEGLRERGLLVPPPATVVLPSSLYRRAAEPPAKGGAARPAAAAPRHAAASAGGSAASGGGSKRKRGGRGGAGADGSEDEWGSDDDGGGGGGAPRGGQRAGLRRGAGPSGGYADSPDEEGEGEGGEEQQGDSGGGEGEAGGAHASPAGSSGGEAAAAAQAPAAAARGRAGGRGGGKAPAAGKQQTLNFAAAAADASSPGPGSKGPSTGQGTGPAAHAPRGRIGGGTAAAARAKAAIAAAAGPAARRRRGGGEGAESGGRGSGGLPAPSESGGTDMDVDGGAPSDGEGEQQQKGQQRRQWRAQGSEGELEAEPPRVVQRRQPASGDAAAARDGAGGGGAAKRPRRGAAGGGGSAATPASEAEAAAASDPETDNTAVTDQAVAPAGRGRRGAAATSKPAAAAARPRQQPSRRAPPRRI
ncbi:hypothetical protein Rsub_07321 [Raphidocelis subcapitata]|uniref:Sister chromatid cohesion protein n=1 Tax=Raphidocelis subcapitata TaxID=307507 RepID=A0A2V0P846_9CHLO|nr:hypothetical protein Rsub_07321 [Raphidocelis subcapitata]|eukprot:GBF94053.1 hypothetical protein Rsub_07321 [Raphidocelis subcapitata]